MKKLLILFLTIGLSSFSYSQNETPYFEEIKIELEKKWPNNRTVNFVFHGHSVPSGYFRGGNVNTFEAYPMLFWGKLKTIYPFAVVNCIVTAIGGENSEQGSARFEQDVLTMKPDVLFIDYALNDRNIGLEKSKECWELMINKALAKNIKVVLLTPSPDLNDKQRELDKYADQIRGIAKKYNLPLVDSYAVFMDKQSEGVNLETLMSQNNHPNKEGHELIASHVIMLFGQ